MALPIGGGQFKVDVSGVLCSDFTEVVFGCSPRDAAFSLFFTLWSHHSHFVVGSKIDVVVHCGILRWCYGGGLP